MADFNLINVPVISAGEISLVTADRILFNPCCITPYLADAVYRRLRRGWGVSVNSLGKDNLSLQCVSDDVYGFCLNGEYIVDGIADMDDAADRVNLAPAFRDLLRAGRMPRDMQIREIFVPFLRNVLEDIPRNAPAWDRDGKGEYFVRYRGNRYYPKDLENLRSPDFPGFSPEDVAGAFAAA